MGTVAIAPAEIGVLEVLNVIPVFGRSISNTLVLMVMREQTQADAKLA